MINKKSERLYDKESKLKLYEELDELFEENQIDLFSVNINACLNKSFDWNENENISILYYTTELDHFNHLMGKSFIYDVLQMYITEKMIEKIIEWINIHDDYALIITSDHGGQEFYTEDSMRNHGEDFPGNEAIFIIYTKDLKDHYEELKMRERYIHINDESDIIPQILLDINIPINSQGFPKKLINDDINELISLKMKEIQLIKLIEKYITKYNNYEEDLKDILKELENIIFFIFICIFIVIKFLFEIYFLFFKIVDIKKAQLINKTSKFFYIFNIFSFLYSYIILFFISLIGENLREGILNYCCYYLYFITIVNFYYIFNILHSIKKDNKIKIILLFFSILFFAVFCQFMSYGDCFFYLKKNLTYFSKSYSIITNFFIVLLFLISKEFAKKEKNYYISFCKKDFNCRYFLFIYLLFLITLFVEDSTRKGYYDQNIANRVFVWINFILYIVLLILSHFVVYEENGDVLGKKRVHGLPYIKQFLFFSFYWFSDKSQRLFCLIILLPFLDIIDNLSNDFQSKINEIIHKNQNNDYKTINKSETSINEIFYINKKNDKKEPNYYLFYIYFYIILQDIFLLANQLTFSLLKYSFGLESERDQKSKTVYVLTFLRPVLSYISKYKYNFIILGFFLEKGIYVKNNNKELSNDFLVRKIMLGFRINIDNIYLFYQMLIKFNDILFGDLFVYCLVNIFMLLYDYLGYGLTLLGQNIC